MTGTIPLDYSGIFMALIFLLLAVVIISQWTQRLGDVGLTFGKWVLIAFAAMLFLWGAYNQIGKFSGSWEALTLDQWITPIFQNLFTLLARLVQWLRDLISGFLSRKSMLFLIQFCG